MFQVYISYRRRSLDLLGTWRKDDFRENIKKWQLPVINAFMRRY